MLNYTTVIVETCIGNLLRAPVMNEYTIALYVLNYHFVQLCAAELRVALIVCLYVVKY